LSIFSKISEKIQETISSSKNETDFLGKIIAGTADNSEKKKISSAVTELGYQPLFAPDTQGLLNMVKEEKPAMVLIDSDLPGPVSGMEIARTIKNVNNVPIIAIMSSFAVHNYKGKSIPGISTMVLKPINKTSLMNSIKLVLFS